MEKITDLNPPPDGEPKPARKCIFVIFGITGDLTKRLLFPAICNLGKNGLLNEEFSVLGVATTDYTDESFREVFATSINEYTKDEAARNFGLHLLPRIYYSLGDFSDPETYQRLKDKLAQLSKKINDSYIFYLAVPPQFFSTIALGLGKVGLLDENSHNFRNLVLEKPFGHDLQSAKQLNNVLLSVAKEQQIFRIDHFLGKETIQNIFTFRFSNDIFEPIWNRHYIDHVQITVAEKLGVELRGRYYDNTGALRDMIPNHLFQVLSFIAMEPPISFSNHQIQEEKLKVIQAIQPFTPENILAQTARGQYAAGEIDDIKVPGYREEKFVNPESNTETYAALKLFLNNWRWLGIPFYIRTGKHMQAKTSIVSIQFKTAASCLFRAGQQILPNLLRIYIQPEEGISLRFNAKVPSQSSLILGQVEMNFKYSDYFGVKPQTGYESILYECINGQHMLFKRAKMTEACWEVVQPILDMWGATTPTNFPNYPAGSWGPAEADALLRKDDREWLV